MHERSKIKFWALGILTASAQNFCSEGSEHRSRTLTRRKRYINQNLRASRAQSRTQFELCRDAAVNARLRTKDGRTAFSQSTLVRSLTANGRPSVLTMICSIQPLIFLSHPPPFRINMMESLYIYGVYDSKTWAFLTFHLFANRIMVRSVGYCIITLLFAILKI